MTAQTVTSDPTSAAVELLAAGYAWTLDRVTAVDPADLHRPTTCDEFDLDQLLGHLAGSIERYTLSLGGEPSPDDPQDPRGRFAGLVERNLAAWSLADPAAMYELPLGTIPAEAVAGVSLAEVVVHGWDVSRATGERADVPDDLAEAVLAVGHAFLTDDVRGAAFAPAQPCGPGASDRMAAFYGRRP